MNSIDSALLFWAITIGYLCIGVVLLAGAHRLERQRKQEQQERATMQRQLSVIQRSVFYLEGMARVARGDVEAMEEEEDADLLVTR